MFDKIKVDETSCAKMQMEVIVVSGLILETKGFTWKGLPDNWRTYIEYACRLYFRI
jgi:hypothetical protein